VGVPSVPISGESAFDLSFDFDFLVFFFVGLEAGGKDDVEFKTVEGTERLGSLNERVLGLSCLPELGGESSSAVDEAGDKLCTATASLDTSKVPTVADTLICVPVPSDVVSGAISDVVEVAAFTISALDGVSVVVSVSEGITSGICVESAFSEVWGSVVSRGESLVSADVVSAGDSSVEIGTGFSETAAEAETGTEGWFIVVAKLSALESPDRDG